MEFTYKFGYKAMLNTILALSFSAGALLAQPDKDVVSDTTEIIIGKKVITIVKDSTNRKGIHIDNEIVVIDDSSDEDTPEKVKHVEASFIDIDLGMNFLTYNRDFNLPSSLGDYEIEPIRSTHVALHLLPTHFNFAKGHVSLLTAVTFDNNRYQFRNNVTPQPGLDSLVLTNDSVLFEKNKLISWYAQVPLLLDFQTNPTNQNRNFHFSFGGFAGLFLGAKTKQVSVEEGKVKRQDDFNLNNFKYGVTARIGYRGVEFYANYQLSSLFREGEGPELHPFNVGLSITSLNTKGN